MLNKDQFKCIICGEIHHVEGSEAVLEYDDYDSCYDVYTVGDDPVCVGTACQRCFEEHSSAWLYKRHGVIFADDMERWNNFDIPHVISPEDEAKENARLKRMDINWNVDFKIAMNGETVRFWDLPKEAQEKILADIRKDSYNGAFSGHGN